MPYQPFTVEQFGGLNLVDDPEEVGVRGAVDLLNIDIDKRGRVRSRDGYDNLTASAAANPLVNVGVFYTYAGTKQFLVNSPAGQFYRAYSTAGATVATDALGASIFDVDFTRFGGPSAEVVYISGNRPGAGPFAVRKWDGSAFAATTVALGGFSPYLLEVQAASNRLVGAFENSQYSRVGFSDPGAPETFGANNYEDLTPGDGERVTSLIAWRELVFAFKETKFFVFTGNSLGAGGTPIFNYRPVSTGVGSISRFAATASPNGVYFLSRRGIYKTTGGDPVLISRAIDPIFRGGASSLYAGGVLNHAALDKCALAWHDERLYFAFPSGSATTNDRVLVYDPEGDYWTLWGIPAAGMTSFRVGDQADLIFSYATGSNHIGRLNSTFTSDDGATITSSYQSGFYDLGSPGSVAHTRWTRLWGSGAPTVSVFTDFGTSDSNAAAVTLGTAPAVAHGYHQKAYKGQMFSHKLSATTVWQANRIQHDIAWVRP